MENTENKENTENTEAAQPTGTARSPRHRGRGAFWMVVLVGTAAALGTAAFMGHAVASGGFGGHHGGRGQMLFKTFDTNKDGTITAAEIDAETQRRLTAHDANGDDALSLEEFQGVWLEMLRSRMVDAFQRFDDDGDGRITKAEIDEKTNWMLSRMDRDEDGKITMKELRPRFRHGDDDGRFEGHKDD